MSRNGLLALAGLLAAALAALYWLGRKEPPAVAPDPTVQLLPGVAEDAVREIDLACAGSSIALSRATPGSWRLKTPREGEADPRRVHELVAALSDARSTRVIADGASDLTAYGLSPAVCTVRLLFDGGAPERTLRIGRTSPVGSERYVVGDDARVVLTGGSLYAAVSREADAFREKRLIPVEPEAITRIVLERPEGRLALARDKGAWHVVSPREDPGSASACDALAREAASIELSGEGAPAPIHTRPERRVMLSVSARDLKSPLVAFIATAGIEGKRLAWRSGATRAGLVEESAVRGLFRPAEEFRDKGGS